MRGGAAQPEGLGPLSTLACGCRVRPALALGQDDGCSDKDPSGVILSPPRAERCSRGPPDYPHGQRCSLSEGTWFWELQCPWKSPELVQTLFQGHLSTRIHTHVRFHKAQLNPGTCVCAHGYSSGTRAREAVMIHSDRLTRVCVCEDAATVSIPVQRTQVVPVVPRCCVGPC